MSARLFLHAPAVALATLLLGCGVASPRFVSRPHAEERTEGSVRHQLEGIASYYADEFHRRQTASGETYDMNAFTAAHRTLPFNTTVRVVNLQNSRSVIVRINDRGPFKDERVIDLSLAAAKQIGLIAEGTAMVRLEILRMGTP